MFIHVQRLPERFGDPSNMRIPVSDPSGKVQQHTSRQIALKWVQHGSHFKIGSELRKGIQAFPPEQRQSEPVASKMVIVFVYDYPAQTSDRERAKIPALRYPQILHGNSTRHRRKRHAG
jgi:hypothetical protein